MSDSVYLIGQKAKRERIRIYRGGEIALCRKRSEVQDVIKAVRQFEWALIEG